MINKELLVIFIVYLLITVFLLITDAVFYTNIINPIFWICIIVYLIWNIRKNYVRFSRNKRYFIYMIIISYIHIMVYFYLGFILGFSKSPYNHGIIAILKNVAIEIIPIIGIEIARGVLVVRNKNNKLLLVLVTILFILIEINYHTLTRLYSNKEELFKYICGTILPLIATSSLYTYLTLKTSFLLPIIFRVFNQLVVLLLPIFPYTDWFTTGSIYILSPAIIYFLFKYKILKDEQSKSKKQEGILAKFSYTLSFILLVTLICFMLGLFQYEPISVLSNSMVPTYNRGDVIIFKKLNESELKEIPNYSIIIYSIGDQTVAHRVVSIIKQNDTVMYQTKGDSNNAPDVNLVQIEQIQGVYVFHMKYIGFPSVWLYSYFHNEEAKVETK